MRSVLSRRYALVSLFILGIIALFPAVVLAYQYSHGPVNSSRAYFDSDCTAHTSYVHYDKSYSPLVIDVDRVYYGGRKPDPIDPNSTLERWRREKTKYYDWNGSQWILDTTVGSGSWRSAGSCSGLDWWYLNNDVSLDDGAYVQQVLRFKYYSILLKKDIEGNGTWHGHNLP